MLLPPTQSWWTSTSLRKYARTHTQTHTHIHIHTLTHTFTHSHTHSHTKDVFVWLSLPLSWHPPSAALTTEKSEEKSFSLETCPPPHKPHPTLHEKKRGKKTQRKVSLKQALAPLPPLTLCLMFHRLKQSSIRQVLPFLMPHRYWNASGKQTQRLYRTSRPNLL